jgi:4-hydroxybenzoate polyprenyltransferase
VNLVPLALSRLPLVRSSLAIFEAMRPRQWSKNLLLFAGLVFAGQLVEDEALVQALAAFVAYCAASSAAYLVNDVRDAVHDREHPAKRLRPIASGAVSTRSALWLSAGLTGVAVALAAALGLRFIAYLCAFVALQLSYTFVLKRLPLVDVLGIAGLFVIRAAAGAAAVRVHISPWLLVCTAVLSLFLAFAKRRAELVLVHANGTPGRPVLSWYSLVGLDRVVVGSAVATAAAYTAYAASWHESLDMLATVPFVAFGLLRYLYLIRRRDLGEEPEEVLLTDIPTIAAVLLWAGVAAIILTQP